jgi:DNA-binding response OmpR family regulator
MPKRLLVVDDDPDIVEGLRQRLTVNNGYDVDTTEDGRQALHKLSASQYDGMIPGIRMPVKGGLDTLKELRRNGAALPIVMMTASRLSDQEKEQIDDEAQGFLPKPFSWEELTALLMRYVGPPI